MEDKIKNLEKVAKRIQKAIKNQERIILYGDADLDGIGSLIILKETIKNLAGDISAVYFPDREVEGYGISEAGLSNLKKFSPALFIALDCGIGNFKETKLAKKLGFEVIIIDHHEILDKLPKASIIVDPKQKGDKYPFKGLATVAISFKLAEVLLAGKMTESLRRNFLELVALATLADMMPKEDENINFIAEGLNSLESSWRPGIQALLDNDYFRDYPDLSQKVSKFISILNIRDVKDSLPASFRLLDASSLEGAEEIIGELVRKGERRRERVQEILEEVEERLIQDEAVIFEGAEDWDFILISTVASILCQKYQKPTFIFKKMEKESSGTVRTPKEINGVSLMKKCKKLLLTYGGHPRAAGFRIKNENVEKFKKCLIKN